MQIHDKLYQSLAAPQLQHDTICDCKESCDGDIRGHQNSQPCTAACERCGLSFDCEDNSAYSNPLTLAALENENGGEINEEAAHENQ